MTRIEEQAVTEGVVCIIWIITQILGIEYIDKINIETAVMTATGFIKDVGGFTCGNQAEAEVKRAVINKADNVIMLLDSSKVNKKTPYTFASLKDVNCMVVDKNFSKDLRAFIEENGTKDF